MVVDQGQRVPGEVVAATVTFLVGLFAIIALLHVRERANPRDIGSLAEYLHSGTGIPGGESMSGLWGAGDVGVASFTLHHPPIRPGDHCAGNTENLFW